MALRLRLSGAVTVRPIWSFGQDRAHSIRLWKSKPKKLHVSAALHGKGHSGIFFYDFASNHFFYTSPTFPFPYLYDFSLNTVLYYFPDPNRPGRYTTNPRYFYNFATGQIITM